MAGDDMVDVFTSLSHLSSFTTHFTLTCIHSPSTFIFISLIHVLIRNESTHLDLLDCKCGFVTAANASNILPFRLTVAQLRR